MAKGNLPLNLIRIEDNFRRNGGGIKSEILFSTYHHFDGKNYTLSIVEVLTDSVHGERYFTFNRNRVKFRELSFGKWIY